jgi:hypothetical protein
MKNSIYGILSCTLFLAACGTNTEPKKEDATVAATPVPVKVVDTVKSTVNEMTDFRFHSVLANLPSPFETIDGLIKSEIAYKKELLNPVESESGYLTSTKKALNYGVYGVDLAYQTSNKELAQAPKYFKATRNLAVSLDAVESFDKIGSRLQGKFENKDTVTHIMDEAFDATDKYLRSNSRELAATEILTGSWVESQYLSLNLLKDQVKNEKNGILFKKVFEQKFHLDNLCKVLKDYEKEADFKPVVEKLLKLNEDLKTIHSEDDITPAKIGELALKVGAVRDLIIK